MTVAENVNDPVVGTHDAVAISLTDNASRKVNSLINEEVTPTSSFGYLSRAVDVRVFSTVLPLMRASMTMIQSLTTMALYCS